MEIGTRDGCGDFFDHRNDARDLGFGIDGVRAGSCRFSADIEQIRAFIDELARMFDGAFRIDKTTAVGKRIGRHVDDAADARPIERKLAAVAVERHMEHRSP